MSRFDFVLPDKPKPQPQQPEQPPVEYNWDLPPSDVDKPIELAKMEENPEGFWDWASLEGARTFLEGMSFEFSDNIGSAISATYFAMQDEGEGLSSWKTYYDMLQKEYREGQDKFELENPVASTALNITGSIANPLSYIKAPATVSGMIARSAGEGALYGIGSAEDSDEILGLATEGAIWGAGTSATLGFMYKGLSRKNIQKDLDGVSESGKEVFTPITLSADIEKGGESTIQSLYRDIVAPTYLAKTAIRNQEDLITNPIEKRIASTKENLDLIGKDVKANTSLLRDKFKETKEQLREGFIQVKNQIGEEITDAKDVMKFNNEKLIYEAKNGLSKYSVEMNQQIQKDLAGFREQVLNLSFPTEVGGKQAQLLVDKVKMAKTPKLQNDAMGELWSLVGFNSVKKNLKGGDRVFPMRTQDLASDVYKRILSDGRKRARIGNKDSLAKIIDNNLTLIDESINKGRVKADDLMTARNELAMKANSFADTTLGDGDRMVLRTAVSAIDDMMMKKLLKANPKNGAEAVKSFQADKQAWNQYVKYRGAVKKRNKAGEKGRFEPSDYIDVLIKQDADGVARDKGLLLQEAETVHDRVTKNRDLIVEDAHSVMRDVTNSQISGLAKLAKQKKKQLEQARKDFKKQYKGEERQFEEALNRKQRGIEIQKLETELSEMQEHLALLNAQRSQRNPSWFQSIAAVGLLGGLALGGVTGAAGAALGGTLIGGALGTKTGQRFVAGQTGMQTALRNNKQTALQTSQLLSRVMADEATQPEQPQQ